MAEREETTTAADESKASLVKKKYTQKDLEHARLEGYKEGYAEGFKDGYQEARASKGLYGDGDDDF
jgi:flagellar biosynthesis/type III secretory pathway protein FliH